MHWCGEVSWDGGCCDRSRGVGSCGGDHRGGPVVGEGSNAGWAFHCCSKGCGGGSTGRVEFGRGGSGGGSMYGRCEYSGGAGCGCECRDRADRGADRGAVVDKDCRGYGYGSGYGDREDDCEGAAGGEEEQVDEHWDEHCIRIDAVDTLRVWRACCGLAHAVHADCSNSCGADGVKEREGKAVRWQEQFERAWEHL